MKHLKLILSILFIFCLTRTYADDSNYLFRHYQVENGLSDNMATCCVQDRKGYIWIGTRDGLNRFDGYTFKVFRNDPDETETLGSNWITCLGCDMNGDLCFRDYISMTMKRNRSGTFLSQQTKGSTSSSSTKTINYGY